MNNIEVRHVKIVVSVFPNCEWNDCKNEAHYDAKTRLGPWGYLCEEHFEQMGIGLGLGKGQRMELIKNI